MTVLVFSGTSEGRQLIEALNENGIFCHAYVATDYGEEVMHPNPLCEIHKGRLDTKGIEEQIYKVNPTYVFDATHPHAVEVSVNIKQACHNACAEETYIRVSREMEEVDITKYDNVCFVDDYDEAVEKCLELICYKENGECKENRIKNKLGGIIQTNELKPKSDETILLTTGVKELSYFAAVPELKNRLIVRILPGIDSLHKARELDIPSGHIVAMEGPFGVEMNLALIHHFNSKVLVTKNSGSRGGFIEKLEASKKAGIVTIVVNAETTRTGIGIKEAVNIAIQKKN